MGNIAGISWIGEGGECGPRTNVLTSLCVAVDCDSDRRRRVGVTGSDAVLGVMGEETFEITYASGVCVRDVNDYDNRIEDDRK